MHAQTAELKKLRVHYGKLNDILFRALSTDKLDSNAKSSIRTLVIQAGLDVEAVGVGNHFDLHDSYALPQ
jgi:hypothetical protein